MGTMKMLIGLRKASFPIENSAGQRGQCGRFVSAIKVDRAEKAAIRGRKGVELSVWGQHFYPNRHHPQLGSRGRSVEADRGHGINRPQKYALSQFSSPYNK